MLVELAAMARESNDVRVHLLINANYSPKKEVLVSCQATLQLWAVQWCSHVSVLLGVLSNYRPSVLAERGLESNDVMEHLLINTNYSGIGE